MTTDAEQLLDTCIERLRAGGNPDELLREHLEAADEIRPLLRLAAELEKLPSPEASIAGVMKTMVRILSEKQRSPRARVVGLIFRPWVMRAAAAVFLVFFLGWATVSISAPTVPGDFLYPIKLLTEKAKFYLTLDPSDRVELRVVFSEQRLKEVLKKYMRGGGIDTELLAQMLAEGERALRGSVDLPDESRGILLSRVGHLTAYQHQVLQNLEKHASPEEQSSIAAYKTCCAERCKWMSNMMNDVGMNCAFPKGDSSEPQKDHSGKLSPSPDKMREWMKSCPTWERRPSECEGRCED